MQQSDQKIKYMTEALSNLFFGIYNWDLATDEITAVRVSDDVKGLVDREKMRGEDFVKMMAEVFYHTRSQNELINTFNSNLLKKYRRDGIDKVERALLRMYKGNYHWVNVTGYLGNGVDDNIIIAVQDIDDQYKERQDQDTMIHSLSSVYYTMYYVDCDTNIITAIDNQMDSDIMLSSRGSFSQMTAVYANNCIHYDDREKFREFMNIHNFKKSLSYENPVIETEYRRIYDYGMEWIRAEVILVSMENGTARRVLFATRNITAARHAEKAASDPGYKKLSGERVPTAAEEYYKKTGYMSVLAEHLRLPANAVIALANAADMSAGNPQRLYPLMQQLKKCGLEIAQLSSNLSDISHIEKGDFDLNPELVPLQDFFASLSEDWEEEVREHGHRLIAHQGILVHDMAEMDRKRMKQVFDSVMDNAVRYTKKPGELTFTLQEVECFDRGRACYELTFTDNGVGIPEEVLSHIYEPFVPVKDMRIRDDQGLGLSLAIVRAIVERMDGHMRITSSMDRGTTVEIRIKLKVQETEDSLKTGQTVMPAMITPDLNSFEGRRVLLYTESSLARELLGTTALDVIARDSLDEVMRTYRESADGYFQIILVQLNPEEIDNLEFAREIHGMDRADAADMPVVALIEKDRIRGDSNVLIDRLNAVEICDMIGLPMSMDDVLQTLGWWIH